MRHASLAAGVPKETFPGEARVSLTPAGAAALRKAGFGEVVVEAGAGAAARFAVRVLPTAAALARIDRQTLTTICLGGVGRSIIVTP